MRHRRDAWQSVTASDFPAPIPATDVVLFPVSLAVLGSFPAKLDA